MSHAHEYAQVFCESRRVARKAHECGACREAGRIKPGIEYVRVSLLGDGHWDVVKLCLRCHAIGKALMERCPQEPIDISLDCGESWRDAFGEDEPDEIAALAFALPGEVT